MQIYQKPEAAIPLQSKSAELSKIMTSFASNFTNNDSKTNVLNLFSVHSSCFFSLLGRYLPAPLVNGEIGFMDDGDHTFSFYPLVTGGGFGMTGVKLSVSGLALSHWVFSFGMLGSGLHFRAAVFLRPLPGLALGMTGVTELRARLAGCGPSFTSGVTSGFSSCVIGSSILC